MKGRVDRETKVHRAVAKARGSRNRAAHHPDYQIPLIVPLWLITAEDLWKLSAEAAKQNHALQVRQATDVEMIRVAQHLREAFDWAIQCDKMQEWEGEPQRKRRWYMRVTRQADGLLKALAQSPEECKNPTKDWKWKSRPVAIDEFRQLLDRMVGARPDLPDQLDAFSRAAWDERGPEIEGSGVDEEGRCQYRARASFLIDRLPRTVALVSLLAQWQLEQLEGRPRGRASQSDLFGRELFKSLAGAHEAIFQCRPLTRQKSGTPIGGSIHWAKAVIRHAADAIESLRIPSHSAPTERQKSPPKTKHSTRSSPHVAALRRTTQISFPSVGPAYW